MSQDASGSSKYSFASGANAGFIEAMYEQFRKDPASVDDTWKQFFSGYELAAYGDTVGQNPSAAHDSAKVEAMINAYRRLGHLSAHLNPLDSAPELQSDLTRETDSVKEIDLNRKFRPANLPQEEMVLGDIIGLLHDTYCRTVGADFRDMNDVNAVVWFQTQMESCRNRPNLSTDLKMQILDKLIQSENFEQFLGRRYLGQKRFSLEGAEALIPLLDVLASEVAENGGEEICIGMAHRGRLNVLANFLGKSYELMLKEFEGSEFNIFDIDGDVKYHKGFASEMQTKKSKSVRLYLSPNPSHLEAVNPVVEGFSASRQRLLNDQKKSKVIPLLIHGDAAFIGQGIVPETLNLSGLSAYTTGGTIHVIINNQIGFTAEPYEYTSSHYASEIAKVIRAPVLHVNADDPEACVWCAQLAVSYRQKFHGDVVIDLVGYRRHGHNEGDEPLFTQPHMYKKIAKHPTCLGLYSDSLISSQVMTKQDYENKLKDFRGRLQAAYELVHGKTNPEVAVPEIPVLLRKSMECRKVARPDVNKSIMTGVGFDELRDIALKITEVPKGFTPNPKLVRLLENRRKMVLDSAGVDWGFAELLAFGTLANEGKHVRLSGQDACRGTFTSRHGVLRDFVSNEPLELLNNVAKGQGKVEIINSPLSEQGVLGFEFGYSVADSEALVCWEAQFGDFANGAQIIIDQFISASEAKWGQWSGIVLMLPHGHEGMGPEHSSARPERFLQLCGNLNMQVVSPTTPAQYFHALRRQMHRDFKKPLVVMSPKSLLRHPECVSDVNNFIDGYFKEILDDPDCHDPEKVERLVMCSGKIYYELVKERREAGGLLGVAIVRLEQSYPFPYDPVKSILKIYQNAKEVIWTQEEPQNMGGWNFVRGRLLDVMSGENLKYVGRKNSGTPAEGSMKAHTVEQARIVKEALGGACGWNPEGKVFR